MVKRNKMKLHELQSLCRENKKEDVVTNNKKLLNKLLKAGKNVEKQKSAKKAMYENYKKD
jgi:hypothetical protein